MGEDDLPLTRGQHIQQAARHDDAAWLTRHRVRDRLLFIKDQEPFTVDSRYRLSPLTAHVPYPVGADSEHGER